MGIYPGEIECPLCGRRHAATFWSLDLSTISGEYGRCAGRSLLLGVMAAKAGIPARREIHVCDPGHLGVLSRMAPRSIPKSPKEYVDPYRPPTLGDLLSDKVR